MNKNLNEKIIYLIIAIIVIIGIGYFANPLRIVNNEKKTLAKKALDEKYNEDFVVKSTSEEDILPKDYYKAIAYSKSNPDIVFEADVDRDGSAVSDNYWAKCICKRISNQISNDISSLGENYVYSRFSIEDMYQTDTSMSLKEANDKNILTEVTMHLIISKNMDSSKLYDNLTSSLKKIPEINGIIKIYKADNKIIEKAKKYLETNPRADYPYEEIIESSYKWSINFNNGSILESKNEFIQELTY